MDVDAALRSERAVLVRADRHIREGETRVGKQEGVVADLQAGRHDAREAERLLDLLRLTLVEWRHHRTLMLERIAYLEARVQERGRTEPAG